MLLYEFERAYSVMNLPIVNFVHFYINLCTYLTAIHRLVITYFYNTKLVWCMRMFHFYFLCRHAVLGI